MTRVRARVSTRKQLTANSSRAPVAVTCVTSGNSLARSGLTGPCRSRLVEMRIGLNSFRDGTPTRLGPPHTVRLYTRHVSDILRRGIDRCTQATRMARVWFRTYWTACEGQCYDTDRHRACRVDRAAVSRWRARSRRWPADTIARHTTTTNS
jgi:hypothetical protein